MQRGRPCTVPRQRVRHNRRLHPVPDDFPQRLEWFGHASGLSWAEIARRIGVTPITVRRWRKAGVRPNYRQLRALHEVADALALLHLLVD